MTAVFPARADSRTEALHALLKQVRLYEELGDQTRRGRAAYCTTVSIALDKALELLGVER